MSTAREHFTRCLLGRVLQVHRIKQSALADEAGIAQSSIARLCSGGRTPTVPIALVVCDALEALTGVPFEISELWVLTGSRPVRGKRGRRKMEEAA